MEFKKGIGWKACFDEERNLYTAERGGMGSYHLYELTKESYDQLDNGVSAVHHIRSCLIMIMKNYAHGQK